MAFRAKEHANQTRTVYEKFNADVFRAGDRPSGAGMQPAGRPLNMTNIVCFGECMVELSRTVDGHWQQGFAGDSFNTATYLARLDCGQRLDVHYASAVGEDVFADEMVSAWRAEGLCQRFVQRVPGGSTGLYAIHVDDHGERSFSYWRECSAARRYFDARISPLEQYADQIDVLYLTGISLAITPPAARPRLWALLERLRAAGKSIAFDNNYRPRLWQHQQEAQQVIGRCLAAANIVLASLDDELTLFSGQNDEAAVVRLAAHVKGELVIKHGDRPVLVQDASGSFKTVPVERVEPVDTTGAGDAFAAGYLYSRLAGNYPLEATRFANQLSAQVVQHPGAIIPPESLTPWRLETVRDRIFNRC